MHNPTPVEMSHPFPSVATYLESLPNGVASYPECTVKASVLRSNLEDRPLGPDVPLPPEVRALVERPPPVSVWLPEVHVAVVMLAVREVHFGPPEFAGYLDWVFDRNRQFLSTTLYRAMFLLVSPERLLVGMQKRWASFRRGSEIRVTRQARSDIDLSIVGPPHLYPVPVLEGMGQALRAAITCAGAANARVDVAKLSPTEGRVRLAWGSA